MILKSVSLAPRRLRSGRPQVPPSTEPRSQLTRNLLGDQRSTLASVRSRCRPSTEPSSSTSSWGVPCSVSACKSGSTGGPGKVTAGWGLVGWRAPLQPRLVRGTTTPSRTCPSGLGSKGSCASKHSATRSPQRGHLSCPIKGRPHLRRCRLRER